MAAAADRDRIARQYVTAFEDVFAIGGAGPAGGHACGRATRPAATLAVYLAFLSAFPDTHVVRKHGPGVAEEVRRTRDAISATRLADRRRAAHLHADLMAGTRELKARGINPGTSADLTVATLFARNLGANEIRATRLAVDTNSD